MQENPTKFDFRVPIIAILCLATGIIIGYRLFSRPGVPLFSGEKKSFDKVNEVLNLIRNEYVDSVENRKLEESAIEGILGKLDPHSVYIPPEEVLAAHEPLEGNFEGIGIEFNIFKDTIQVVAPVNGGPSESVGIKAGDKIITVNEETVAGTGISNRGVMQRLRGPKGTQVKVGILRKGKSKKISFTIRRDKIPTYSVDVSYMINETIGYIKISRFASTTYSEFLEGLTKLKDSGMERLIIDLRNNYGG